MKVAVLGAGAFGTAFCKILERHDHEICLWAWTEDEAQGLRRTRQNPNMPGVMLAPGVKVTSDLQEALNGAKLIVGVTPFNAIRGTLAQAKDYLEPDAVLVNGSKGLEMETFRTAEQVYREVLPAEIAERAVFVSGPTFAKELAAGLPAALVGASQRLESVEWVREAIASPTFRIFSSKDTVGVCLAGALKNVYAIAAGASDSLGYGLNARAALISRASAEMTQLGVKLGADPMTFMGLAGIGDLVLTCTGDLSRNRRLGLALGEGKTPEQAFAELHGIAEGYYTARAIHRMSRKLKIKLPIAHLIYRFLFEGLELHKAVKILLSLHTDHEVNYA